MELCRALLSHLIGLVQKRIGYTLWIMKDGRCGGEQVPRLPLISISYRRPVFAEIYGCTAACSQENQALKMASQNPSNNAYVLGVGLTQFLKPRRTREYPELGYEAAVKALLDAQISYDVVQQGIACYSYGDTTSGWF